MTEPRLIELSKPQFELVTSPWRYPAFVGGFGSGKTEALINRALKLKYEFPYNDIAYYLPTYDLVSTIGFPRFEEKLEDLGLPYKSRTGTKPRIMFEGAGDMLFRTMDNPARIVGYEVADSLVDELDTLKTPDAKLVWQKVVARNRQKKKKLDLATNKIIEAEISNTIAVGTTPEGFRFVYELWKKAPPDEQYKIIKASTYSNLRNLPADYIADLLALYPSNLIEAYINGEFVNLTSGSVYPQFDRILNGTTETLQDGEPIHIGQDFNVANMASVIFVIRNNEPIAIDELTKVFDTPTLIVMLKQRYPNRQIFIYPDASGNARKSNNASESDISLLKSANFIVIHNPANPLVRDRVLSVNAMICSNKNVRRLKVNVDKCPSFTTGLEQQAYDKNGEPDKTSGLDHSVDAGGYFITNRYPVVRHNASHIKVTGI